MDFVDSYLKESIAGLDAFAGNPQTRVTINAFVHAMVKALRGGNKILLAGNGGSAADAQHIAGEFVSRLFFDRAPLPAIALTTDTSILTAVGNDYGYEKIFERQVQGLGKPGDIFIGISTSGQSPNIVRALDAARSIGITTAGFTGADGREMTSRCDLLLKAPSNKTSIIQQIHIVAAHIICGLVEQHMFDSAKPSIER